MIQASELRVGNWMNHNGRNLQVQTIDTQGDGSFAGVLAIEYSENDWYRMTTSYDGVLKPIPLTPEILEAAGFEKIDAVKFILGHGYFYDHANHWVRMAADGAWPIITTNIEFMHQLQNLFYSLTRKELEINILNPA